MKQTFEKTLAVGLAAAATLVGCGGNEKDNGEARRPGSPCH